MGEWVALVVALIAALAAIVSYGMQKTVDRKSALILKRREAYLHYLKCVLSSSSSFNKPDASYRLNVARMELVLLASDDVLRSLDAFDNFSKETSASARSGEQVKKMKELLSDLIARMRKDCFDKTSLRQADLYRILPFND